jgi:hypothetical protein
VSRYRDTSMRVEVEPTTIEVQHDGKAVAVEVDSRGYFRVRYRTEGLLLGDLEGLRKQMSRLDDDAAAKRERSKALKAAAANPIPALFGDGLEPVLVRGIDARSGHALLVREDGSKGSSGSSRYQQGEGLYRLLSPAERGRFVEARQDHQDAQATLAEHEPKDRYDVSRQDVSIAAFWDAEQGDFHASHDGTEFRAARVDDILSQVIVHECRKQFPYALVDDQVALTRTVDDAAFRFGNLKLFLRAEEVAAYRDAMAVAQAASATFEAVKAEYVFDLAQVGGSPGEEEPDADPAP